ncbi:MAG: hypothetical protein GY754_11225 [bacterium]|nr:hypothetical protein [bacterium]
MDISGSEKIEKQLEKAVKFFENPIEMNNQIAVSVVGSTQGRFEEEVDPEGNNWHLEPVTIKKKRKIGKTKKLQLSGNLKSSVTKQVSLQKIVIGSPVEYSKYLHEGTGNMKKKVIFGISAEDETMIEYIIDWHVNKLL